MTKEQQAKLSEFRADVDACGKRAKSLCAEAELISIECKQLHAEAMTMRRVSKPWNDRVDMATKRAKQYESNLSQCKKDMLILLDLLTKVIGDNPNDDGLAESMTILIDGMHRMSLKETTD